MITKAENKKLKRFLKNDYVTEVYEELNNLGYVTSKGTKPSESLIRNVFAGNRSNSIIEEVIFSVYNKRKQQYRIMRSRRNKILSA